MLRDVVRLMIAMLWNLTSELLEEFGRDLPRTQDLYPPRNGEGKYEKMRCLVKQCANKFAGLETNLSEPSLSGRP